MVRFLRVFALTIVVVPVVLVLVATAPLAWLNWQCRRALGDDL